MLGGLENPGLSTSEKLVDERLQLPIVDKVRVGTVLSHVMGKLGLAALGKLPPEFPAIVVGLRNGIWREERLGVRDTAGAELAEMALAHTIRNKAEAAYARTDLLERRRELMEAWSEYLAATATNAE